MNKIIISSMREGAGKTSVIAGIISAVKKNYGYIKPLGDRLIYRRKKSWDYDSNLIISLLGLEESVESHYEDITLGFDHSKLRYMYDEEGIKYSLFEMVKDIGEGKDVLFVEGGRDLSFGTSIYLDPISVSKYINGKLIIIISGDSDTIIDDINFIDKYLHTNDINFGGILINKVNNSEDFNNLYIPLIKDMGIDIVGVIPFKEELTYFTVGFLAEKLMAKVIVGEQGLGAIVKNILVGAISSGDKLISLRSCKENQLIIIEGDKSDIILSALEHNPVGIILTNNIVPSQKVISKVSEREIPLILVTTNTCQAAKQVDEMEALLTRDSEDKIKLLTQLTDKYVDINKIFC